MSTIFDLEQKYFLQTYKRLSIDVVKGEGCYLYDRGGIQYLDFFGGLAVNALGYGHAHIVEAIRQQTNQYIHLSNFFVQEPQIRLAELLINASGYHKLFLTNSGTEAVEGAIKLARKWGVKRQKKNLFGLSNSFHGRTMGALSLTERAKYREGYEPFLPNTGHIRFNDVSDLQSKVDDKTLGVVIEVIQGEGGVNVASREFCEELSSLQKKYGLLIIADEIQCGIGRTGTFFGFQHTGLRPDIVVVAKALGGGLPLGAVLATQEVSSAFTFGVHGTTFGGNPVACAAGTMVLQEVVEGGLMQRAGKIGDRLISAFRGLQKELTGAVTDVRGFGCMVGVQLSKDGQPVVDELQRRGILINCTNANVLRFLPPYIVSDEQCDRVIAELTSVLKP